MERKAKILILDDEPEVLKSLNRLFRRDYEVEVFDNPYRALSFVKQHHPAVIISDMRMPVMSGDDFLCQSLQLSPESNRILLTGYSDIGATVNAVNKGKISSFIAKPWDNDLFKQDVKAAVDDFNLRQKTLKRQTALAKSRQELMSKNEDLTHKVSEHSGLVSQMNKKLRRANKRQRDLLHDIVDMITLIIDDVTEEQHGHVKRVAAHCRFVAETMCLEKHVVNRCYLTGLMHEMGKVAMHESLIKAVESELCPNDLMLRQRHAVKGAEILKRVPHFVDVALAVRHQYEHFNGQGNPGHLSARAIPVAARILVIVNDFDKLMIGRMTGVPVAVSQAKRVLQEQAGKRYDPAIVEVYLSCLNQLHDMPDYFPDVCIGLEMVKPGMVLARDLKGKQSHTLLTEGTRLTPHIIEKLFLYQKDWSTVLNVFVR